MKHAVIRLKPKEDGRIASGHLWVFSNEVARMDGSAAAGDVVEVKSSRDGSLGFGFYNPNTLIAVRLFSKEFLEPDRDFFLARFKAAIELRSQMFDVPFYRLVHGESDFLPGLIVDRFGQLVSIQIFSIAMEKRISFIVDAIKELISPLAIYERNESSTRELEGLPQRKSILHGTELTSDYDEDGVTFRISPYSGQKTGFYFDQRLNRIFSRKFARNKNVLDLFSNEGGFALHGARAGAGSVVAVDSSAVATASLIANAELNGFRCVTAKTMDVSDYLASAVEAGEKYDVVVCDPPSFTRNRKSVAAAKAAYKRLHEKIFSVIKRDGILLTSSCSHHIFRETFESLVNESALKCGRTLQLLHRAGAGPDHPIIPAMPETEYLKFAAYKVA